MLYGEYDDFDAREIRAEEEFAKMCSKAEKILIKRWKSTREGKIYCRAVEEHPHFVRLIEELECRLQHYLDEHLEDCIKDLYDEEIERKDPYGYRGVSQRDFF